MVGASSDLIKEARVVVRRSGRFARVWVPGNGGIGCQELALEKKGKQKVEYVERDTIDVM